MSIQFTEKNSLMHMQKDKDFKVMIGQTALKKGMLDLGPNAFKLFIWFHGIKDGWVFQNKQVAATLGMSVRTMQYAKKEMVDKDYLWIEHEKRYDHYYIGPKMVTKFKKKYNIPLNKKVA